MLQFLPKSLDGRVYHEPFLGAATVFLALRPRRAHLSDLNRHLIQCYQHIQRHPRNVARALQQLAVANDSGNYYQVRESYNKSVDSGAQAARFIYLNRTCFNGIFRVNKQGTFNVPYGKKEFPVFPKTSHLIDLSNAMKHATIREEHFSESIERAQKGDFMYLDPPYPPLSGTAYFTHYTLDRFGERDQLELADAVLDAISRGVLVMMSNADTPLIRKLYKGLHMHELEVRRYITCKSTKHKVNELILTSYPHRL